MEQKVIIYIATFILIITGALLGYVLSQLVLGFLTLNLLTFLGTFSLIVIFATLYYVLFWEFRRQQAQPIPSGGVIRTNQSTPDPRLKSRLITMLSGDSNAAERLIAQAKQESPGMPENWYWEREIANLERDRG